MMKYDVSLNLYNKYLLFLVAFPCLPGTCRCKWPYFSIRLFVATIAYQLVSLFTAFRLDITREVTECLTSESMSVEEQLETLIL